MTGYKVNYEFSSQIKFKNVDNMRPQSNTLYSLHERPASTDLNSFTDLYPSTSSGTKKSMNQGLDSVYRSIAFLAAIISCAVDFIPNIAHGNNPLNKRIIWHPPHIVCSQRTESERYLAAALYLNRKTGDWVHVLSGVEWRRSLRPHSFEALWDFHDPMPFLFNLYHLGKGFAF